MKKPEILSIIRQYFFAILGAALGLIVAVLFMTIGFWRTLLILVLMGAGILGGLMLDKRKKFVDFLDRILPGTKPENDEQDFF